MLPELVVSLVVVAVDSRFLDGPVWSTDGWAWSGGARCRWLGRSGRSGARGSGRSSRRDFGQVGELNAVVGQDGMQAVGHGRDQSLQEACGARPVGLLMELGEGELGGPINRDEQVELAGFGADLGNVDVEIADRIGLELALVRLVALYLRQARDAVPLQTSVE